jgi:hypothetical protein
MLASSQKSKALCNLEVAHKILKERKHAHNKLPSFLVAQDLAFIEKSIEDFLNVMNEENTQTKGDKHE